MIYREDCPDCLGTGEEFNGEDLVRCKKCKGEGFLLIDSEDNYMMDDGIDFPDPPDIDFEEFDEDKHSPLD